MTLTNRDVAQDIGLINRDIGLHVFSILLQQMGMGLAPAYEPMNLRVQGVTSHTLETVQYKHSGMEPSR
jgi:hypothetical protein